MKYVPNANVKNINVQNELFGISETLRIFGEWVGLTELNKTPNKETIEAFEEDLSNRPKFENIKELFEDLERD